MGGNCAQKWIVLFSTLNLISVFRLWLSVSLVHNINMFFFLKMDKIAAVFAVNQEEYLHSPWIIHAKKLLGCFNPTLRQIWTNPAIGLHFYYYIFNPTFGFVHIRPKVGLKQPSMFRVKLWSQFLTQFWVKYGQTQTLG